MADLISREAAIAEIEEYIEKYSELEPETGYHNLKWCAMEEAKDVLSMLPAVDAVPVVHGRWVDENPDDSLDPRMRCSICTGIESPLLKWRYCPNCGALMDGERRDSE